MSNEFKTYRANAEGYDGDKLRLDGEEFTTNIPQGSWMDELDADGNVIERPKHTPAPGGTKSPASVPASADAGALEALTNGILALVLTKLGESGIASAPPAVQPEPGPLDKSIPDLTAYLEDISDVGAIDALIEAEKGGKSRSGALEALEARKAALQGS